MKTNLVYITAAGRKEAESIGRDLVSGRLAAGANIIDNIRSIYWWEGKIRDHEEAIVVVKTRESLVPELIERVKSIHSYDCPCIVSLPIIDGNRPFIDWIIEETG